MAKEKSLSKNTILYLIYNILNIAFPFLTGMYVARILLTKDIGEIESAKNLAQYFVIFSFLGIPTYGLREIAKVKNDLEERNKVFSELFVINAISTSIFLLLYFVLISSVPTYRSHFIVYSISGLSIALNFINISWLYEGLEEFGYITIRNLVFKAVSFVLLVVFVRTQSDFLIYALISVVGTGGNYIANVIHSRKSVKLSFRKLNLKRHLRSIFYLVVVNLAIEIYTLMDITMLRLLCNSERVAIYSYGLKIYKILVHIIGTFTVVVVPRMSFLFNHKKHEEFNFLVNSTLSNICLISLPCIAGVLFVSAPIIVFLYGSDYSGSSTVLKILSISLIISPVSYLLGSRVMLVAGKEKKMIIPVVSGAAVNLIANFVLITLYGENGAAVATVLSELVVALIYICLSHRYFRINKVFYISILKSIASVFVMSLLISYYFFVGEKSIIKIIAMAVFTYFSSLLLLKEINIHHYLSRFLGKLF